MVILPEQKDPVIALCEMLNFIAPHNVIKNFVDTIQLQVSQQQAVPPPVNAVEQVIEPVFTNINTGKSMDSVMLSYWNFGNVVPNIKSKENPYSAVGLASSAPYREQMQRESPPEMSEDSAYLVRHSPIADFATGAQQSIGTVFF